MRSFRNIAELIRQKRLQHPKGLSQSDLSSLLGYKNGQFISNVERALCNIPLKMLSKVSHILEIGPEELKEAIMRDHGETIDNYLSLGQENVKIFRPSEGPAVAANPSGATAQTPYASGDNYKLTSNS